MDTAELKRRLAKKGFEPTVYSIEGSSLPGHEGLILQRSDGRWKLDHFERGLRRELGSSGSEE